MHTAHHDPRNPQHAERNLERLTSSNIIRTLAASCLTVDDIDNAVDTFGSDLKVICHPEIPGMPEVAGKVGHISAMSVTGNGRIWATVIHAEKEYEALTVHPVPLPTDKILSILRGEDTGEIDIKDLRHSWLISLEDIRQRYEEHAAKKIAARFDFFKEAMLAFDPTLFDTKSEGPEDEFETGDLVRAKPKLCSAMSLGGDHVGYIYDTDTTVAWLSRWNANNPGLEQADCVVAYLGFDNLLEFKAANTQRLMRLAEDEGRSHGNRFNPAFAAEIKAHHF